MAHRRPLPNFHDRVRFLRKELSILKGRAGGHLPLLGMRSSQVIISKKIKIKIKIKQYKNQMK